jgi:hypothetical protein
MIAARRAAVLSALSIFAPHVSRAEPYRLRADVLGTARAPTGVVALEGDLNHDRWLDAEVLLWTGAGDLFGTEADVLVAAVRVRDLDHGHDARIGRLLLATGALPPVHMDGAIARVRLPWNGMVEAFTGLPVVARFGERSYDWLAGGRISQSFGTGAIGAAYLHRRDHGRLSDHEIGFDAGLWPLERFDLGGRASYDLASPGISEAQVTAGLDLDPFRIEATGSHRSPSRILPATSLFAVLGDIPSQLVSLGVRWRAAPRLDLVADLGARRFEEELGEDLRLRAVLRFGDRSVGSVALEGRRVGTPGASWSGGRAILDVPLADTIAVSTELELAWPDTKEQGRARVWPWALAALSWKPSERWAVAVAIEASASSRYEYAVDGLLRAAYAWSTP